MYPSILEILHLAEGLVLLSNACSLLACVCWLGEEMASRTGAGHGSLADLVVCGMVKFWRSETCRNG